MNVIREAQEHHRSVELQEGLSVCPSVGPSVRWLVTIFFTPKMEVFPYDCHQGGPGTSQK